MTEVWITIAGLTLATMALKAAGPVILGGRELPERALAVIALLAPALLAALVLTGTFTRRAGAHARPARRRARGAPRSPRCCARRCS